MKEDLRVQKTKAALFKAFYELLTEKGYDDITVNELCERATIRRATFYKHYRDKEDFFVSIVKKFRSDFDEIIWRGRKPGTTYEYFVKYSETLVSYLDSMPALVKNLLDGPTREPFINIMIRQNFADTVERLTVAEENGLKLRVSVDSAAAMLTGGVSFIIVSWFINGRRLSSEQLRDEIGVMIRAILAP